uniref:non-specific protein-tyrosine kinase n=1 Tax=candidate division WOR-3 bacterium TaxID=2052148 RepID=A0A7C3N5N8_UNCW3
MLEDLQEQEKLSLNDYLAIVSKYKVLILVIALLIFFLSVVLTLLEKPKYTAKTILMFERVNTGSTFFPVTDPLGMEALLNNQTQILKSRSLMERVNLALKEDTILKQKGYTKVSASRQNLSISKIQDTYIIEVVYKTTDPFLAAYITNKIAREYYKMNLDAMRMTVSQVRIFLEEQLKKIETELNHSELLLRDYKKSNKISSLEDETKILINQVSQFETDYKGILLNIDTYTKQKEYLLRELDQTQKEMLENISSYRTNVMENIFAEISKLETDKAYFISQGYSNEHPKILEINSKIESLKNQLKDETEKSLKENTVPKNPLKYSGDIVQQIVEINNNISLLQAKAEALKKVIDVYNSRLENVPDQSIQLVRLERNAKVNEDIYLMLKRRYEEAKLQEVAEVGNVSIIDTAVVSKIPVSPKKEKNFLMGIILGIFFGITVAFILFFLDESIRTTEEVEHYTGEQILGIITYIGGNGRKDKSKGEKKVSEDEMIEKMRKKLIINMEPHAPIAEAYRSIRTQIKYRSKEGEKLVYVFTSSIPGEGKSTTISNLGITMANLGKKVVLIDADMRKPVIHKIFNVRNGIGLAHYINGKATFEEIKRDTEVDNLTVITYGTRPINPSELLENPKMKELLEICKNDYDYVLVDAPPVNVVTDPIVLANYADKLLWVVSPGKVKRKDLRHARKLLVPVKRKILGVILNSSKTEVSSYYSVYYKKYYGEGEL